jgi:hypothetical protein
MQTDDPKDKKKPEKVQPKQVQPKPDKRHGITITVITAKVKVPTVNGPFFHATQEHTTGTVQGKEGEVSTTNFTKDNEGGGLDKNVKVAGVSVGLGVDNSGFAISVGFSNSTYSAGASKEGLTYGSSMTEGTNVIGNKTTVTPTPLSGFGIVGAAVLTGISKIIPYIPEL